MTAIRNAHPSSMLFRLTTVVVSTATLVTAAYGCSSSNSTSPASSSDAGSSRPTTGEAGASGSTGSGSTSSSSGSSQTVAGGGDAGAIAQKTNVTYLYEDTADAGLVPSGTTVQHVDPNLVNPWGLAFSPSGVAWISDNGTNVATTYTATGAVALAPIAIPAAPEDDGGSSNPSGQIYNPVAADFLGDKFILCTEEGTVYGWKPTTDAGAPGIRYDGFPNGAVYKGLAIVPQTAEDGSAAAPILLVADLHNARLDVFDTSYNLITPSGGTAWVNPSLPAGNAATDAAPAEGYAPFNVATFAVNGTSYVYVTYGLQDEFLHDAQNLSGAGVVAVFKTDGTFVKNLVSSGGVLETPWGMALVPSGGWGSLPANALLVGNFGDGTINAFDALEGTWLGDLVDTSGQLFALPGLWALTWGEETDAGESPSQLYFTAGPNGENDGLYGYLTVAP